MVTKLIAFSLRHRLLVLILAVAVAAAGLYAARHLAVRLRTPLFQIERTTCTVAGVIAEYRRGVLRGDIYRYRIELR